MREMPLMRSCWLAAVALLSAGAAQTAGALHGPALATPPSPTEHLNHGRFKDLVIYKTTGTPSSFVLFLSGDEGWNSMADTTARQLVERGAMVAGIDWTRFKANLESDGDQCVFPDGDLENLSHFVQAYFHLPNYLSPLLVGISSGGSMAYATLAQAPRNTFAAAITVGFCPSLGMQKPLCKGSGFESAPSAHGMGMEFVPIKSLGNPWLNLQRESDQACPAGAAKNFISQVRGAAMISSSPRWMPQFLAGYTKLAAQNPAISVAPTPASLADLPVVEIPARPAAGPGAVGASDAFAIIMSGDGGWAGLDQDVAAALSANGVPVVGLDSLRYYWTARTPDGLAADTDRLIRYYLPHFGKQRVLLIGYSQGADVLPFAVNRLSQATRARIALTAVMGMSEHALFEFHLSSWIADSNAGPETLPEINRITGMPVLCIYGAEESDSLCPKLDPKKFHIVKLKGGHHFDGDYGGLAQQILAAAKL